MLLRPPPARRSLSLPRLRSPARPQALLAYSATQSRITTTGQRLLVTRSELLPWRRKNLRSGLGPSQERSLATALDDARIQDDIPFDKLASQRTPSLYSNPYGPPKPLYELRGFNPLTPLQLKVPNDPYPRARTNPQGVPGDVETMLSLFDACLLVGNLNRASLVLKRFSSMGDAIPSEDLVLLHNRYLRANIQQAFEYLDSNWSEAMRTWYEVQIRGEGLPQTAETIACMLKASLISVQGKRLERLITRYMGMLPGAESEILSHSDILNDDDMAKITAICPYEPQTDDWQAAMEQMEIESSEASTESVEMAQVPEISKKMATMNSTPNVLETPQKGLGLKSLKKVLSFFHGIETQDFSKLPLQERREIQSLLEKSAVEAAIARWKEEHEALSKMGRTTALSSKALNSQLYDWHCTLEAKLRQEFASFDEAEALTIKLEKDQEKCLIAPYMRQSDPTRLAAVTILTVLNTLATQGVDGGVPLLVAIMNLAKAVEEDVKIQARQREDSQKKAKSRSQAQQATVSPDQKSQSQPASVDQEANPNVFDAPTYDTQSWPTEVKTKLGASLLKAMIETAKVSVVREHPDTKALVSQIQPAVAHTTIFRKGKRQGLLMPNKHLVDLLKREPRGDFLARHLPMLVEPEPWSKFDKGGFIDHPANLIRVKQGERDQRIYAEAAVKRGDLDQVCKGLDVLGRTAWQINRPVFNVMIDAWNSGEKMANIPPLHPDLPIPPEPEANEDPLARRSWIKAVKAVENEKSGLHSERCFMNFQLEIARAFRDQTFYFPHNMDFRGRAYPIPTYLNHMGADHVRGLLRFAKGKELGENGLRWLKIHLANVFGFDKASLSERESFATDHVSDIYDSVADPLGGKRWWLKAEDPWQCLAACFELKAALDSPDPLKYISHLPVHQDGTCNGLQHYAALGGDLWGAQQVNLEPGDKPADVYSAVAELVRQSIAEDLKADHELARAVDGKITRKVVKQTVMTNVYGVTFIGAKAQVLKQIDAAYPTIEKETGIPASLLASYIATKIFKALSTMFRGAHDIQYWLGECAGRVCRAITPEQLDRIQASSPSPSSTKKSASSLKKQASRTAKGDKMGVDELLRQFRSTIVWTTPLRMPVVQPYRKSGSRIISTSVQDLNLTIPERSDPVNRRKQLQAFPPNFIHSLDASHMLLSALECDDLGLTFAAVHDSFWTHAGDIDVMNRVLRDAFIRIHEEDVVGRLASEFEARYKGSLHLAKVPAGSKLEREISAWRQKNKMNMKAELFLERERQQLLQSSDPEEVAQGQKMVTPASIFDQHAASQAHDAVEEMEEVGLGNIPSEDVVKAALEAEMAEDDGLASSKGTTEDPEVYQQLLSKSDFEIKITGKETKKTSARANRTQVWLPLTLPEIPEKGDWDVTRLKTSQYFFS